MDRKQRIFERMKFNRLSEAHKLLLSWNSFIEYDYVASKNKALVFEYLELRHYLENIVDLHKINRDFLPKCNKDNFISVWFECHKMLNLESFKEIKDEFFEIKWRYNGYTAVDLTLNK